MKNFTNNKTIISLLGSIEDKINKDISLGKMVFPDKNRILRCLDMDINSLNVVILGQDPYHGFGQANGLAFSVNKGTKLPPSLKNIYKEIENEFNFNMNFNNGDLSCWEKQGVLLLNTTLTVIEKSPSSHSKIGWNLFTDELIRYISKEKPGVVFMLWGAHAQQKIIHIDDTKHLILSSSHPSPFSARKGFFGNRHFIKANEYLIGLGKNPISWQIS